VNSYKELQILGTLLLYTWKTLQCKYLHYTNVLKSPQLANQYHRRNLRNLYIRFGKIHPKEDETVTLINGMPYNAALNAPHNSDRIMMMGVILM
jgi:hypothetical protein